MSKHSHYIGLTIGPIFPTLDKARSTRELWAASYLFSHLMRLIVDEVRQIEGIEILTPSLKVDWNDPNLRSIGLYPDRMILKSEQGKVHFEQIQDHCKRIKKRLAYQIAARIFDEDVDKNKAEIEKSIITALQTYLVLMPIEEGGKQYSDEELSNLLDAAELQLQFQQSPPNDMDYVKQFLIDIKERWKTARIIFDNSLDEVKSLERIATNGLETEANKALFRKLEKDYTEWINSNKNKATLDDSGEWIKRLKQHPNLKNSFKTHHKYIAIVYADGDNVGSTFGSLENDKDFIALSDTMAEFGKEATHTIKQYGGLPIYIGGDDLVFFAPVQNNKRENVFWLAKQLNTLFKEKVSSYERPELLLSFGISISYYKFPMNEALKQAQHLLFKKAKYWNKDKKDKTVEKNALAFRILKHSGYYLEEILDLRTQPETKGKTLFECLEGLMRSHVEKEERLLNSVTYNLQKTAAVLNAVMKSKETELQKRAKVANFLKNNFNEEVHNSDAIQAYFKQLEDLILAAFAQEKTRKRSKSDERDALYNVYTILRIVNFLKRKDTTDE